MNWGKGIIMVFAAFAVTSVSLLVFSMRQNIDLVTTSYYQDELKYQEKIEKNTLAQSEGNRLKINTGQGKLILRFPADTLTKGTIKLYRPSDASKDLSMPVAVNDSGEQYISTSQMEKGLWKIQVEWESKGNSLYEEKNIFIKN